MSDSDHAEAPRGSAPAVELQVLGPLRLLIDGRPAELGPTRRRTLLAALAVDTGQAVGVDTLADRVWDGSPPASPAATLQAYVSRLRTGMRSFDADGAERLVPLLTEAPGYRLAVDPDTVDAHRFHAGIDAGREALASGDAAAADRSVRAALALWRGEAYADIPADFARREAQRLAELRLGARELKARIDLSLGRHEAVVTEVATLLEAEPMRESLHAVLVLALYRGGRQADALGQLEAARRLIAEELGVDPGPELRRLQEQILRQDAALDRAPASSPAPGPGSGPEVTAVQEVAPPVAARTGDRLHGRDGELARLMSVLDRVEAGQTSSLVVTGEAGIGKTRVLEETSALAAARGMSTTWGRCWAHEGAPVLWPWVQALESLAEQTPPGDLTAALEGSAAGVAALVPALVPALGGPAPLGSVAPGPATPSTGTEPARVRLYDAVARFLAQLSLRRPLLLVLEDMHWADHASRELTEFVATTVRTARLGLVLSVRSPTEDASRTGSELLTSLARSGRTERIDLGGLGREAISGYVVERTGSLLDDATSAALLDRTGGNPFFVGELVRLLITDLDENRDLDVARAVPDSVREVIARRVERLGETDQTVLRVASVVGRVFDLELIQAASGLDEDAVDDSVDRATEFGILQSDPDDPRRHRFVHALTQQTLLETTGPAKVRRLHSRVGSALAARTGSAAMTPELAERLAYHLTQSGGPDELERAVDVCLEAADAAFAQGNHPEAEALLLRALALIGRLGPTGELREMTARVRLWTLYTVVQGPDSTEALGQHERTLDLIRRHGGASEILAGHQAMWSLLNWRDDLDGIATVAEEMTAAAEAADDDLMRLAAHLARAQMLAHRGHFEESYAEFAGASVFDHAAADAPPGVFALEADTSRHMWTLLTATVLGRAEEAAASRSFVESRVVHGPPVPASYNQILLALTHAFRDEPAEALTLADRADTLMREQGLSDGLVFLTPVRAWARERVMPGAGLDELLASLAATAAMPTFALRPSLRGFAVDVLLRAGRIPEAAAMLEAAFAEAELSGNRFSLVELHRLQALALVTAGSDDAAVRAAFDAGRSLAEEQGCVLFGRRLEATEAEVRRAAPPARPR